MKNQLNIKNIYNYLQGNVRYKLYYSPFKGLLREHIREQIRYRIIIMDQDCYESGSCKKCGCMTPHLQMANISCDKPCYPPIMNAKKWMLYSALEGVKIGNHIWKQSKSALMKSSYYSEKSIINVTIFRDNKIMHFQTIEE